MSMEEEEAIFENLPDLDQVIILIADRSVIIDRDEETGEVSVIIKNLETDERTFIKLGDPEVKQVGPV